MRRLLPLLALALAFPAATSSAGAASPAAHSAEPTASAPSARCPGCNVLLVSVDTLRGDHVGCLGHARDTLPEVCAFFREGLVFRRAMAQSSWTGPAHASIFTGLYPFQHGVADGPLAPPVRDVPNLFGVLRAHGWFTAAAHGGGYVDQALRESDVDALRAGKEMTFRRDLVRDFEELLAERPAGRPFLYFLHGYDPHLEYKPTRNWFVPRHPAYDARVEALEVCQWQDLPDGSRRIAPASVPADPEERAYLATLYDSEIRDVDRALGRLLRHLEATGLLDRTVVVFTSDHGEELFEHGSCDHVKTLYQEVLHVPLMVRVPGGPRDTVDASVPASLGILPTLLEILEIDAEAGGRRLEAASLLRHVAPPGHPAQLAGGDAAPPVFSSTAFRYDGRHLRRFAAQRGCAKVILDASGGGDAAVARYDLCADPTEQRPLEGTPSPAVAALEDALRAHVRRALAAPAEAGTDATPDGPDLDCATLERLAELGYVSRETFAARCDSEPQPR